MNAFQKLAATNRPAFIIARKGLQAENRKMPVTMTKQDHTPKNESEPHGVWRSRDFLCCAYLQGQNLRLSVCRTEIDNRGMWKEDISWDDLQRIKRECGYGDQWAVEVFPAEEHLVNIASMRHLWVVDVPPFAWVRKPVCPNCEGRGEIGGITASDPGGISEPCPECNPQPELFPAVE